jgi:kynureninase
MTTTTNQDLPFQPDEQYARGCDASDPLRGYRERFLIPPAPGGGDSVYFCGNSLGLQPVTARTYVLEVMDDWAALGVDGHFHAKHAWMPYHELLRDQTARVVGAMPHEVAVMNTLTVNLHLMMVSFYRPEPYRHKILIEGRAFPSDQYAAQSQLRYHGFDPSTGLLELQPRDGESTLRTEDILGVIDRQGNEIALLLLGGVNYYTGQLYDLEAIVPAARARGIMVGLDLAHAAGNVPLRLHDWGADFAVWCTYKYLNSGPGNTAGCFVHDRHAGLRDIPRFEGWWGHDPATRFLMRPEFVPARGADAWQLSNQSILPLAALRASMDIFDEAGMEALRAKSLRLTAYLEYLLRRDATARVEIITPADPAQRGAQLSLRVARNGKALFRHLSDQGVVCDWREPDVIRVAPAPLYNTFLDACRFRDILRSYEESPSHE